MTSQIAEAMTTSGDITYLPGHYRVHFDTPENRYRLWLEIEVKRGHPRGFIRAVGPPGDKPIASPWLKRQVYLDTVVPGCEIQFHGKYTRMLHKVKTIERLGP